MADFKVRMSVRWGDLDAFNHVSNVTYLRYLEEARARWMDSVPSHWQDGEAGPVVANVNINFRRPLHWPAEIEIVTRPQSPGRSSIKLACEIRSSSEAPDKAELHADATVTLVWIDKKSGEPVPLPGAIRELAKG